MPLLRFKSRSAKTSFTMPPTQALSQVISDVHQRLSEASKISLFLDFDGTLVPIETDPSSPRLNTHTADTLKLIEGKHGVVTTIISGRAVEDLYSRIRLDGLIYAGNHGLEIFGQHLCFVEPIAAARRETLARLCEEIARELALIAGAAVEYKGLTASVHYRNASEEDFPEIMRVVYAAVATERKLFRLTSGNKVIEIVPDTKWHKGAAVEWINRHIGGEDVLPIYLGDDATDEDAFRVLTNAITVKVGRGQATTAKYHLPDPTSVHEFLEWLAAH